MATLTKRMRGGSLTFEIQFYAGGTRKTAKEHYLRVREEDFDRTLCESHPETAGKNAPQTGFPATGKSLPAILPAAQRCKALQELEAPEWSARD